MRELIERATLAASQVFDDVESASHVETQPTGVSVFSVARRSGGQVTVTLNPNGLGAGVEWRCKSRGNGYRTFKLQGLAVEQEATP
jgi:hypothetical protein